MFPGCPYPLSLIKASPSTQPGGLGPRPLVHVGPGGVVPAAPDSSPCPVFPASCVTSLAAPFPAATGSAGQQASEV